MPKVPYTPYPTVQPEHRGTPFMNISTPPAAFGVATAQAIEGAGRELEKVGNEQFQSAVQMKKLENETLVSKAKADNLVAQGMLAEKFLTQKGLNAGQEQYEDYVRQLEDTRQKIRAGLPNVAAQRDFDAESLQVQASHIRIGGGHSAREVISARKAANKAELDLDIDSGVKNTDPRAIPATLERIKQQALKSEEAEGKDKPTQDYVVKKYQGEFIINYAKGLLRDGQPLLAKSFLEGNKNNLVGNQFDRTYDLVKHHVDQAGAFAIADGNKDNDKTEKQRLEENKAEALKHGTDPAWLNMVDQATKSRAIFEKSVKANDKVQSQNTIEDGFSGNLSGGRAPRDWAEFIGIPGMQDTIDRMDPKDRNQVLPRFNRYRAAAEKTENLREFNKLKGMAEEDPSRFINEDITKYDINRGQMNTMMALQRERRKNSEGDRLVGRALHILGPSLAPDAMNLSKKKDENEWFHFVGTLQDALNDEAQAKGGKRELSNDEIKKVGRQVLQMYDVPTTAFGRMWYGPGMPFFEKARQIPEEDFNKMQEQIMEKNPGYIPQPYEVYREIVRQQYKNTFGPKRAPSLGE